MKSDPMDTIQQWLGGGGEGGEREQALKKALLRASQGLPYFGLPPPPSP